MNDSNPKEAIIGLSHFSLTTIKLSVRLPDDKEYMTATGFFYKKCENFVYLVTNWHVVTGGRNPNNPANSPGGVIPIYLNGLVHSNIQNPRHVDIEKHILLKIPLNSECGENPKWYEHPIHKSKVDVVVVKIPRAGMEFVSEFNTLMEYPFFEPTCIPNVMDDIFVVGYPWGLTGGTPALPIYKRGSIASEPSILHQNLPRFYIDCRTNSGMSGSPVLLSKWMILPDKSKFGTFQNFAGIYSGRLQSETGEISEIGIVWRKEVIDQIIEGSMLGTPFSALL